MNWSGLGYLGDTTTDFSHVRDLHGANSLIYGDLKVFAELQTPVGWFVNKCSLI